MIKYPEKPWNWKNILKNKSLRREARKFIKTNNI